MKPIYWASSGMLLLAFYSCSNPEPSPGMSYASYRYPLWKAMVSAGYQIDFLGSRTDNAQYAPVNGLLFDPHHEGTGGHTTVDIIERINSTKEVIGHVDAVLLGVGINDLYQGAEPSDIIENLRTIVHSLRWVNPNITIIVEQIAGARTGANSGELNALVAEYNRLVYGMTTEFNSTLSPVLSVDMYSGFSASHFADEVHYNDAGASLVANRYFKALTAQFGDQHALRILPLGDSRVAGP